MSRYIKISELMTGVFFIGFLFLFSITDSSVFTQQMNPPVTDATTLPDELLTPERVQNSIDGAISYLRQRQKKNGEWEGYPSFEPGTTALCTLALLTAGLDKNDPTIMSALDYLRTFTPEMENQTYPIAVQTMVFCLADPEKDRVRIQKNVDWLTSRQLHTQNDFDGGWAYVGAFPDRERADNSNSQFAMLALYEAERIGIEINPVVWERAEAYWVRMQNDDGSWGYRSSTQNAPGFHSGYGTGSMTCAGIAALVICHGARQNGRAFVENDTIICCQEKEDPIAERIEHGLAWLVKHFSIRKNPGEDEDLASDANFYYYLYGLERVGRLTANRFIGQSDWYREGTDVLLRRKGAISIYWNAQVDLEMNHSISTAFVLLFLSKGRWPVLASKYQYDDENQWNEHPNDLNHLTQYIEKEWKMNLIWQVINAEKATVDDLLQTPILYLCGTRSPIPDSPDKKNHMIQTLRGYLEQGGFIFAEALDGDESFETGFYALMKEILPDQESDFHLLDPEHPVWNAEKNIPSDLIRPIYGIDYGCRTSVMFIPSYKPDTGNSMPPSVFDDRPSLSCLWEIHSSFPQRENYSDSVQSQITAAMDIGENIFAYATNRELKYKDEISQTAAQDMLKQEYRDSEIFAALLNHGGGSACAPRAIPRLMQAVQKELGIPTQTYVQRLKADSSELFNYPILFMHGRNSFKFSTKERENLRKYFDRGGFLFANAICASPMFQEAFTAEMEQIFPDVKPEPIPLDDPIFTDRYGGYTIKKLRMKHRQKTAGQKGKTVIQESAPELLGIRRNNRWIVVFSPYDVSCALEQQGTLECSGYTTKSAFQLSVNVLLYSIEHL